MSMIRALHLEESTGRNAAYAELPHVLLVLDQFPKTLGGGERIVLKLAALLPQYGYRVSILTFSADPASAGLQSPPCSVYVLPLQRTYDLTAIRGSLELRKFLKEQQVRIVQTFFESSDIWAGFVTKVMSSAKLIWSRRDMGILRTGKHHAAYRLMAGVPDKVFAVSEQVRRHCIEVDGIDPSRVQTVYNGLDLADWNADSRSAERAGESIVATVGNIRRVKGHDIFIRAAASIAEKFSNTSFRIAGDVLEPEYFAELQALVSELKLSGRFHFVGGVTDLRGYLSAAEVFVLPSRSEGFSNAIVEAMAAALPVVATDVGGNAEAVQDGVSGIIVPPEDSDALASAIISLLSDIAKAKKMGAEGKRLAAEKFTTEAMMGQITSVYATLLRGE
ncbi:glycosyltransferase family 4 protein [Tunturiibacter gelidoferens]|uniref:Glycosyltransferase involved in cell wall biosynthesis n=2 Tax=Tunturiibacter TaxID=3154218 RepID=A0A7Y9T269_9BACT|nr:glycosyltransferase family 4 protein [Edaphobacter lichenicola]MBB5339832.1 glycosyltransferase involved in cell wall biosynthesis [Edaphobacter lichenicola]NYF50847.1 glycosyltransferase involved in cell wall biosynthesis [Edaphobacter lichenicola]